MMWPFRKQIPTVDLTNETFAWWLRAQRPPWDWFLRQPDLIQAQLATLGDDYLAQCVELGSSMAGDSPESDEDATRRLVVTAAEALMGSKRGPVAPQAPLPSPPLSMAGVTQRQEEREQAEQNGKDEMRRLFGRAPDSVEATTIDPTPREASD